MRTVASDLDVEIRNGVGAPGSARRAVGRLADRLPQPRLEGLQLLVSELVTNSVRHAGMGPDGRIRVRVRLVHDTIRLEVTDGGPGFVPPRLEPSVYSESRLGSLPGGPDLRSLGRALAADDLRMARACARSS